MKKITRLIALTLICISAHSLTSCLSNDNDSDAKTITHEQALAYMRQVGGNYKGKLYFYNDTITTSNSKVDSVNIEMSITANDSNIVVKNIPGRVFSKLFRGTHYEELRNALDALPAQELTARYVFYSVTDTEFIYYGVYPINKTLNVTYGGKEHKISFNYYSMMNANGQYMQNETAFPLYLQEIRIDNMQERVLNTTGSYMDQDCILSIRGTRQ